MDSKISRALVKGERKHNIITFNPTKVKMGEKLYVTIPHLDSSLSIVPGSMNLVYNLKNSNDKSWPLNNLSKLFVQGLQVKLGRDIVYDNVGESIFRIYEDLWLSQEKRDQLVSHGITSVETRKSLVGTSGASTSSTTNGSKDADLASILENQRISLGHTLDNHGLHNPGKFETKYTLTLPDNSSDIGEHLSGESVGNFTLENLELEYDTVMNENIVAEQHNELSQGKNYIVKHISQESVTEWDKDATLINENLHINRESLKAIVFLFKWVDQKWDEDYIYPNITEVSCSVNGKPNIVHTNTMKPEIFEREARRFFGGENMSTGKFFKSAFSIVLDFRPLGKMNEYNDGVKVHGNSGIQVTFKRKATTKNARCFTYVISDSIAQIDSGGYQKTLL